MSSRDARLAVFRDGQRRRTLEAARRAVAALHNQDDSRAPAASPSLSGCLAIICTARTGSTYLAEEVERRYRIGPIRESLSIPQLAQRAARKGLASPEAALRETVAVASASAAGWFGFKADARALLLGESLGFIDTYFPGMEFVWLLRRSLVDQAVSAAKAKLTGRWHSTQAVQRPVSASDYPHDLIAAGAASICRGVDMLSQYLAATGKTVARLYYEDFCTGDFTAVEAAIDRLGVPRRPVIEDKVRRELTKIGDDINAEWSRRFRCDASAQTVRLIERYERLYLD